MKKWLTTLVGLWGFCVIADEVYHPRAPEVHSISQKGIVAVSCEGETGTLKAGERIGRWTLMAVTGASTRQPSAVFEDFSQQRGEIVFVGADGKKIELPKSLEQTSVDPKSLYRGHTLKEVFDSDRDLLGDEVL